MSSPSTRALALGLALSALVALAGCKTAEERAEEHYQSGLALIEDGDIDRALVELRNVFQLDGLHREARLKYAEVLRDRGQFQEAYRHYRLLAEQYPQDPAPRKWLFRIAMIANDFDEAEQHGAKAVELAPDDPEIRAIAAMLAYQRAVFDEVPEDRRAAAARLSQTAGDVDDLLLFVPTLIDNHVREGEFRAALEKIDSLLALNETLEHWQQLKLQVLIELEEDDAVVAQLEYLVGLFPASSEYATALVQWHMSKDNPKAAEAFLRSQAETAPGDEKFDLQLQLVAFVSATAGPDAAIAELERLVGDTDRPELLRAMRAGLLFDKGMRDEAIAEMQAIVDTADTADTADISRLHDIGVNLAQMLVFVGREAEARERIDAVLAEDSSHPEALKLHAAWLIKADRMDEAIIELRLALSRKSDDAEIMALMADAHLRNGSRNLAGEMLALAVETSDYAAQQALTYARFLIADRNHRTAEDILVEALRSDPEDPDLLALLGRVHIETGDWTRAEEVEAWLRDLGTDTAAALADAQRVDWLRAQERGQEAIRFLTDLAGSAEGNNSAEIAVARTHMENGNFDDAEAFIEARLEATPAHPEMRMLLAALYAQTSRGNEAKVILRELVEEDPTREIVWRTLYETEMRLGAFDEASAILGEALAALPTSPDLLWAKAGELERDGDIEGAIAVYDSLYERLPNSPIIANNLASLISVHREGPEELERAFNIVRRLRGTDVPAFQDTYGWIAHLRGDTDEAIRHLEPAAAALPREPQAQFHLGMAYAAAERYELALDHLTRSLELAPNGAETPAIEAARAEIARIETELALQENGN